MSTEDIDLEIDSSQEELYEHHKVVVDKGQKLLRVDKFLTNKLEGISRNRLQVAASANCILVNDEPVKSNYKVKAGDVVRLVLAHPTYEQLLTPENIPLDIVYEDDIYAQRFIEHYLAHEFITTAGELRDWYQGFFEMREKAISEEAYPPH